MPDLPYLIPLGPDDLRAAGIPEPWAFGMADRVRFAELDALNHVNNAAYLSWFEALRVHYASAYDVSQYRPEDPRIVIRDVSVRYHAEMFLGETYIVTARTARYRRTSYTMEYAVFSGSLRATGTAVVVLLDPAGGKDRVPIPDHVLAAFRDRDGAVSDA